MVRNPTLRHHSSPVGDRCIIAEGENARVRELGGEERSGPWLGFALGGPCVLEIAGQAVYEYDANQKSKLSADYQFA